MAEEVVERRRARVGFARHPLNSILLPVPIICFIGALATDLSYEASGGNLLWVNFSSWLLAVGLLFGALAGLLLLIDIARLPGLRNGFGWGAFIALLAAWIVGLVNSLVHARDGWTAVVPTGLLLSVIGVILVLAYGWLWHETRYEPEGERA